MENKNTQPVDSLATINGYFRRGTEILMYSTEVKKVEDVVEGDLLMGDDSTPRKVCLGSLVRNQLPLFRLNPNIDGHDILICNTDHVLVLKINIVPYINQKNRPYGIRYTTVYYYVDSNHKVRRKFGSERITREDAEKDLSKIVHSEVIWCISVKEYLTLSKSFRSHCRMLKPDRVDFAANTWFAEVCQRAFGRALSI